MTPRNFNLDFPRTPRRDYTLVIVAGVLVMLFLAAVLFGNVFAPGVL